MKTSVHQYGNNCRTCMNELDDTKTYIFGDDNIVKMISECTTLRLSANDELMDHICQECLQKLIVSYNFKEKCEYVNNFLNSLLVPQNTPTADLEPITIETTTPSFLCPKCNKTFTRNASLMMHLERHQKKRIHKCGLCSKSFATNQDLKEHVHRHTNSKLVQCGTCHKVYSSKSALKKHQMTHSDHKAYLCSFCGKGFKVADTLQTHIKIHTKENLLACAFCDQKFAARTSRQLHMKKHTGEAQYLCSFCGSRFSTNSGVKQHERLHKNVPR